ncbi:MAG TPA: hypothetical protein VLX92_08660 [Kofleriaceae bacterium]|nr:hypothetical protein [Kofleriaceae bacterium]
MGGTTALTLGDVERAIAARDPQLGELLVRYLAQGDPEPGRPELDDGDPDAPTPDVPAGAFTLARLQVAISPRGLAGKTPTERKLARREAFAAAAGSPFAPPRLRIGQVLIELYERGEPHGRAALIHAFAQANLRWGVWQAAKTIYKRAEQRHDAALFGVLAYRFDAMATTPHAELGGGTLTYLRRRAWRYLRQLGRAVPEAYVVFACEVLRHYPASYRGGSWVAAHIWAHGQMRHARASWSFAPPGQLAQRAYPPAWQLSPAPLLGLLESALNEQVCDFAIAALRTDHPLALRAVEPAWLARLGRRPIAAIHAFVVQLMKDSPELHQSKLRGLGLHDTVIGFLRSPSEAARAFALEYAAAHAPDLTIAELVELVLQGGAVGKFAAARLEARPPGELGIAVLCRLLVVAEAPWAALKLAQGYAPGQLDVATFVDTAVRGAAAYNALVKFYNDAHATIPAGHFTALVDDPRMAAPNQRGVMTTVFAELAKRAARDIGIAWIQRSFERRDRTDVVARWLDAGMLSGPDLDVDWLKGLVAKPRLRPLALRLLGDRRRVAPSSVGLAWLLELARSSDRPLAEFAQRMLLESFEPDDFASSDATAAGHPGVAKVWELATGKKQPEAVRAFAATYLQAHHPDLGPRLPEAKALGIKPRLGHDAYALAIVRPLLSDDRADVRRLAVAIAGEELARWNVPDVLYELAGSPYREPRVLGAELLLGIDGDARRVPAAWLDGRRLFALAESPHKPAREVALTLIRKLYDRVGGAERLAWLMDSADRDVRLFAVRLFWERHRPRPWPDDFAPRKAIGAPIAFQRFADLAALREFARVVLFGLPPGRIGERDPIAPGAPAPERPLPAAIAKRRMIEALRDVALEDVELARAVAPLFREFAESNAKGEWQASVQALVALRSRHRELAP